jgi:hypothetical protein
MVDIKAYAWQIVTDFKKISENEWLDRYYRPFARGLSEGQSNLLADILSVYEDFEINKKYTKQQGKSLVNGFIANYNNGGI